MLKTIRNRIVGMMKRFLIVRSLQPRAAARELPSSVVITAVATRDLLSLVRKIKRRGRLCPLRSHAGYCTRPYFLNVAFQSAANESSASLAVPWPAVIYG